MSESHPWMRYVAHVARSDSQAEIARRTGLDNSTVSRWLNPSPRAVIGAAPATIRAFALAYERPVLEAFVHAGFLEPEEAGLHTGPVDWGQISDAEFLTEVERRLVVLRRDRPKETPPE